MRSTLKEQCASLTHHLVWAFRPCGCGSVCVCGWFVCMRVSCQYTGRIWHCQSARLTGSSESKQWVKTNLTNYLLPAIRTPIPPTHSLARPFSGLLALLCPGHLHFPLSLSLSSCPLLCDMALPTSISSPFFHHLGHDWPRRTRSINKSSPLAHNLDPPFLFAWQKWRITVIDFHVAGTSGKLFEGLCCDEYQIWGWSRRGKIGWEGDRGSAGWERKLKRRGEKMLTLFSGPMFWLFLPLISILHFASPSLPIFFFTPGVLLSLFLLLNLFSLSSYIFTSHHPDSSSLLSIFLSLYFFSLAFWWLRSRHADPS